MELNYQKIMIYNQRKNDTVYLQLRQVLQFLRTLLVYKLKTRSMIQYSFDLIYI